jgi:hypothetical protein
VVQIDITLYEERPGVGRLGRHREHDPRSRAYAVEPAAAGKVDRSPILWDRYSAILDQGDIGACTGNAMAGWLGCAPHCTSKADAAQYDETFALKLYSLATRLDRIPGYYSPGDPDSQDAGSSGLAVAKAARKLALIRSYGWAFSLNGLIHALRSGPVIVGVPWFSGMDHPDRNGLIEATGEIRGGHEFLIRGWQPSGPLDGVFTADNSWGPSWARNGSMFFTAKTWTELAAQQADVTVPRP